MLPLPSSGSNLLLEEFLVDFDFDSHVALAELFYVLAETFAIYLKNIEPIIGLASYIYLYIEGENMKKQKIWTIVSFLALMGLVACGDGDSSSGAVDEASNIEVVDEENSSESKISSSSVKESSSSKKVSSSTRNPRAVRRFLQAASRNPRAVRRFLQAASRNPRVVRRFLQAASRNPRAARRFLQAV